MERLYSWKEANETLQRVRPWLIELQGLVTELDRVKTQLEGIADAARLNGRAMESQQLAQEIERLSTAAQRIFTDLAELGIELKDHRAGLIDFRTRRDGRTVYLCWKLGEGDIAYWHDLDTGFAGRQPLTGQ